MAIDRLKDATVDVGRRTAVYFGRRDNEEPASTSLAPVRRSLLSDAQWAAWLALVSTLVVLGLFAWNPATVAGEAAIGIVVGGLGYYFVSVREQLPNGALPTAPADAVCTPPEPRPRKVLWMILAVPLCAAVAWFSEWIEAGGSAAVPGAPAGFLAASLFGAWRVQRWEQRHRACLAKQWHQDEIELLALPAPSALQR